MLKETEFSKIYRSDDFNYNFNKMNGYTEIWGDTKEHNPEYAPFPVICDMEITGNCYGIGTKFGCFGDKATADSNVCKFCYKSNIPGMGHYMNFDTAKTIIDKLPKGLTQIAFGVDASLITNPDWYSIFSYARNNGIIPNVTVADINESTAEKLGSVVGACAVSKYANDEVFYTTINNLKKYKVNQVNVHYMISKETVAGAYKMIDDMKSNGMLEKINAIVFLSLKRKGRGETFHNLSQEEYEKLISYCINNNIPFGMDSCSANKFLKFIDKNDEYKKFIPFVSPCESTLESAYINTDGYFFPCSFTEGTKNWKTGISVIDCKDFITDIWNNPRTLLFREELIMNKRNCPCYQV